MGSVPYRIKKRIWASSLSISCANEMDKGIHLTASDILIFREIKCREKKFGRVSSFESTMQEVVAKWINAALLNVIILFEVILRVKKSGAPH
jgi:hypothetical protein